MSAVSLLLRVQRNPVPVAVRHHGAEPVRPNRVLRLDNFPAVSANFGDSFIETTFGVEVQQRTDATGGRLLGDEEATADPFVIVIEKADGETRPSLFLDRLAQHGGVEFDSPIQIGDRNIEPYDEIVFHGKSGGGVNE